MKNRYRKYWVEKEKEWHTNKIGVYHVSSVGSDHSDLDPNMHYGPCIRKTFYTYTDPIDHSINSMGNLRVGNEVHSRIQEIQKKNDPRCIVEFPLSIKIGDIRLVGSVDLVRFKSDKKYDVIDFKTASQYTLPKNKFSKNPTYFTQVYIYAYLLEKYFISDYQQIDKLKIVYINKHNYATYEIIEKYDKNKAEKIFKSFKQRAKLLDTYLKNDILPKKEQMKWCKYCNYVDRCDANVKCDKDIPPMTDKQLTVLFEKKTGKHALWGDKKTKGYKEWLKRRGIL